MLQKEWLSIFMEDYGGCWEDGNPVLLEDLQGEGKAAAGVRKNERETKQLNARYQINAINLYI